MKKQIITLAVAALLLSSCGIYTKYERPEVKTDGLYGQDIEVEDTPSIASLSWRELFTDSELQSLIEHALQGNTDLQSAQWRIKEAEATLSSARLAYLDDIFPRQITTLYSTRENIRSCLKTADLVIGAVLLPGRAAPKLVRREDLSLMKPGAVLVDVAVDQGGCIETTHATTHADPVFMVDGIVHYCVANMPGAVARTATQALVNTTLSYGLRLAADGVEKACAADPGLLLGLNCYDGHCTFPGVAEALNLEYVDPKTLI